MCHPAAIENEPTVPAPQMGEAGRSVEITYWSAAWQAIVDGRGDTIQDVYPPPVWTITRSIPNR